MFKLVVLLLIGCACALDIHPGSAVPGGPFKMKQSDIDKAKDLHDGLDMAVNKLNARHSRKENNFRLVAENIIGASRQVVSGFIYNVNVNMATSSCENTDENDDKKIEDCPADADAEKKICKFRIYSQQWHPVPARRLQITGIYC